MSVAHLYLLGGLGSGGELNFAAKHGFRGENVHFLQGTSSVVHFDTNLASAIGRSRVLVVEGYLWEIPQTIEAIAKACEAAHQQGVLVALTASDVSCVKRHHQQFW
jgi:sugar/nucleoside kinase (ribokinase family)